MTNPIPSLRHVSTDVDKNDKDGFAAHYGKGAHYIGFACNSMNSVGVGFLNESS